MNGVLFLASLYFGLGTIWVLRLCISYAHIKHSRRTVETAAPRAHIDILLPVLEEDVRLQEFVHYFSQVIRPVYPEFTIWIITTEQEASTSANPRTWQVADELATQYSYVRRIHYPKKGGVMAHQLNFALSQVHAKDLFVVYNADSQPDPQTFGWIASELSRQKAPRLIFQQYGNYLRNYPMLRKQKWHHLFIANGLHQNRCTLGFEYYKALQGRWRHGLPFWLRPLNYCVGHGLFFTPTLVQSMQFSEESRNEDYKTAHQWLSRARHQPSASPPLLAHHPALQYRSRYHRQ